MATRNELKAQGYSDAEIDKALIGREMGAPVENWALKPRQEIAQPAPSVTTNAAVPAPAPMSPDNVTPADRAAASVNEPAPAPSVVTTTQKSGEAPVTTTKTESKPQSYYDSSVGREQEILDNLNKFKQQGIVDAEKVKQMAGYDTADQRKKQIIDAFNQTNVKDADGWFAQLASGVSVFNPKNLENADYRIAKTRFDAVKSVSTLPDADISSQYRSGKLSPTVMRDLERIDPVKYQNVLRLNKINGGITNDVTKSEEAATGDIITAFSKLFATKGEATIKDTIYADPDIKAAFDKKKALADEIANLTAAANKVDDDVDAELKGTGATASYIAAKKAARKKTIINELNAKEASYNNALANMNDLVGWKLKDMERQDKIESEQRGFAQDIMKARFWQELALETSQKKFEQELAQKSAMASDPVLATQDVIDQYRKLGIMAQRSDAEIIAEVKRKVLSGQTLGDALTELNKAFQSKPEYKAKIGGEVQFKEFGGDMYEIRNGKLTKVIEWKGQSTQDWSKLDEDTLYNQRTGETKKVSALKSWASAEELLSVPDGTVIPSRLKSTTNPNNGKECGEYVNDITKIGLGDSLESKLAKMNVKVMQSSSTAPKWTGVGNVAVWVPDPSNKNFAKYGHAGIITNDLGDSWEIRSSNINGDGAVTTDTVPKSKILGYATKNYLPKRKELGAADFEAFNSLTPSEKSKKQNDPDYRAFNEKKGAVMSDPNASIYEVMDFSRGGKDMGEERLKSLGKFWQALNQVSELQKALGDQTTWPIIGTLREYNPYDSSAQALKARMNSLVPNIARGVYGEVGVLTDQDIELYKKTLPNLRSTEDTNKLVLAMTLSAMINGFKTQIQIDGAGGRDVSGFSGTVKRYENEVNSLLNSIGNAKSGASSDRATQLRDRLKSLRSQ